MKRDFLEGLGLEKDVIDKIMTENGNDINREKAKADEYKSQLDAAKETLKGFEGVDVGQLKDEITKLNADLAAKDSEYQAKIADMEFDAALNAAVSSSKAKNAKAVIANLDVATLKTSKNQTEDINNALKALKESDAYLFESDEPIHTAVAQQSGTGDSGMMASIRAAMDLD